MKTIYQIASILVFSLIVEAAFSTNSVPLESLETRASEMVKVICTEITLSDTQKVVLLQKSKTYFIKRDEAGNLSDKTQKMTLRVEAEKEFKSAIDSIFTPEQKDRYKTLHAE